MTTKLLGPYDEPRNSGAIVAVHFGDYRRQEIWTSSGANIGNWYPLGGEFGTPKVVEDPRTGLEKMSTRYVWRQPAGTIPLHPTWSDVLARGPVTPLTAGDDATYAEGWKNGRRALWDSMEGLIHDEPEESQ